MAEGERGMHPLANTSLLVLWNLFDDSVHLWIGILVCVFQSPWVWLMRICSWARSSFWVSAKYQSIIKQWIDKISSFKTDPQVLVNYQGKYFIVSFLATSWLYSWRRVLSEAFPFLRAPGACIDMEEIRLSEHSENPYRSQHSNRSYLVNHNLISSIIHGYFIVAKVHITSCLNIKSCLVSDG